MTILRTRLRGHLLGFLGEYLYIVSTGIASLLNYALYPVIAQFLPERDLASVITVLSLTSQSVGLLSALNIATFYFTRSSRERPKDDTVHIQKLVLFLCLCLIAVFMLLTPWLLPLINIGNFAFIPWLSLILIVSIPLFAWTGSVQANKKLGKLGVVTLASSAIQIIFATMFGRLYGGPGVVFGTAIGQLLGLVVFYLVLRDSLPSWKTVLIPPNKLDWKFGKKNLNYLSSSVVSVGLLSIVQIADLLSYRSLETQDRSYEVIFLVSRLLFFAGAIAMWTIIPNLRTGVNDNNQPFFMRLTKLYILCLSVVIFIGYFVGPRLIEVFFGTQLEDSVILVLSLLHKSIILLFTFAVTYALARGRYSSLFPVIAVTLGHIVVWFALSNVYFGWILLLFSVCTLFGLLLIVVNTRNILPNHEQI